MSFRRLIVIGAGAVGGSIGGMLADAELPIALVARGIHGRKIRESGLRLRTPDRDLRLHPPVYENVHQVDWQKDDLALLAIKLTDARPLLDELRRSGGPDLPVALATNGVHGERWAAERFATVLSMLVWLPATHLQPGEVWLHAGPCPGVLDTGVFNTDGLKTKAGDSGAAEPVHRDGSVIGEQLCDWLRRAGFDARYRAEIGQWKYAKWITNLGSAAQALVTDDWKLVAATAQAEGESVLAAAGVARIATATLLDRCRHVALRPIDGRHREGGSTWQSYRRGKPLETPWIEGAMADLAASLGVPAPVNRRLADAARQPRPFEAHDFLAAD